MLSIAVGLRREVLGAGRMTRGRRGNITPGNGDGVGLQSSTGGDAPCPRVEIVCNLPPPPAHPSKSPEPGKSTVSPPPQLRFRGLRLKASQQLTIHVIIPIKVRRMTGFPSPGLCVAQAPSFG